MQGKSVFASKTFWFNILAGVTAVAGVFGLDLGLDADTQAKIVGGIIAVVNVALRIVTKEPVRLST